MAESLILPLLLADTDEAITLASDHLETIGRKNSMLLLEDHVVPGSAMKAIEARAEELGWNKNMIQRLVGGIMGDSEDE